MSQWNFFDPASKPVLIRAITDHSEQMLALAGEPDAWHSPTACGHWEVRDVVGHLVDTTDGYLRAFGAARGGPAVADPLGLAVMSSTVDAGALQFRNKSQVELLEHLRSSRADMLSVLDELTDAEWGELIVPHPYMGPLPSAFYAAGQLIDYAIHTWDIVQGSGRAHALERDAADLLVPFCLIVWQHTATPSEEPLEIGLRISGRNRGEHRIAVSTEGTVIEPGAIDDLETVLDFDAASFVLTAMGRINAGSYRGDRMTAERFANGFFRI